jgi:regulator of protease activity HflC (stomatin/prohibitin superfamily)
VNDLQHLSLVLSPDSPAGGGGGAQPQVPGPGPGGTGRRPRSVTLRAGQAEAEEGPSLDPASKSLADALRVLFRLLQLSLLLIAGLYVLSGFQSVREGQSGIRLLFGKIDAERLDPGFRFAFPYPIGELVKVETGARTFKIDEEFWPAITNPADKDRPVDQLPKLASLRPEGDGSLITADNNLLHARWEVIYSRRDPGDWAESILTTNEEQIVRSAVKRSVVHAVAESTIDDVLRQTGDQGTVSARASDLAQKMLDAMGTGIQLDTVNLVTKIPPTATLESFNRVQSASEQASKARDEAEQQARRVLNNAAGAAAPALLAEIDRYEVEIEKGDASAAAATLDRINRLLENRGMTVDGKEVAIQTGGNVSSMINDAQIYRTTVVATAQQDLATFEAKSEQFAKNPKVLIHTEWANALSTFYGRSNVQSFFLPPNTQVLDLLLNPDPDIIREFERVRNTQVAEQAEEERRRKQRERQFETDTGLKELPG